MNPLTAHTGHLVEGLGWSKEKPTVTGWYWWRLDDRRIYSVRIIDYRGDGELYVREDESLTALSECSGEWSGPIPLPTDAPAQDWYQASEVEALVPTLETAQKLLEIYAGEHANPTAAYTALEIERLLDQLRKGRG